MKLCKKSISDTTVGHGRGPGRPAAAVNSRQVHTVLKAVQIPISDSGKRLDKKAAPTGGKNKPQQAAWK